MDAVVNQGDQLVQVISVIDDNNQPVNLEGGHIHYKLADQIDKTEADVDTIKLNLVGGIASQVEITIDIAMDPGRYRQECKATTAEGLGPFTIESSTVFVMSSLVGADV